jgi:putative transposase
MQRHEMERVRAVDRYQRGEKVASIAASYGRSVRWVYKWVERAQEGGVWYSDSSRRPVTIARKTPEAIVALIVSLREQLEREGSFSGAQSIMWELEERGIGVPSERTVNRILQAHGFFEQKARRYEPKGRRYPAPPAIAANDLHQADFVGPRYIHGDGRFYALNNIDVVTMRARTIPLRTRAAEDVVSAIWTCWQTLGTPKRWQVDNELVFWGSRRFPRGLSQVIRLCLQHGVEPVFIPPGEPWRNSIIEKFNDHCQSKFLRRMTFDSFDQLITEAVDFDGRHNSRWRYSKTGGKTPNDALRATNAQLAFPTSSPPRLPLPKPTSGRIHLVRFIRSDRRLDIFGEHFRLPADCTYEYVTATIDVAQQCLATSVDGREVATFQYKL